MMGSPEHRKRDAKFVMSDGVTASKDVNYLFPSGRVLVSGPQKPVPITCVCGPVKLTKGDRSKSCAYKGHSRDVFAQVLKEVDISKGFADSLRQPTESRGTRSTVSPVPNGFL
jgi:hypothetical protein